MIHKQLFYGEKLPNTLTEEETYKYFLLYNQGSIEAKKKIIEHNIKLVIYLVNEQFWSLNEEFEELVEIGIFGLIDAVETYKIELEKPFASYARRCICNEILMYIRKLKHQHPTFSLYEPISNSNDKKCDMNKFDIIEDDFDFFDNILDKEMYERVKSYLDLLTNIERTVIKMRYGFDCQPMTQVEVAKKLGISQSYLSRIEIRALKKLKMYFELDFNHKDIVKKIK